MAIAADGAGAEDCCRDSRASELEDMESLLPTDGRRGRPRPPAVGAGFASCRHLVLPSLLAAALAAALLCRAGRQPAPVELEAADLGAAVVEVQRPPSTTPLPADVSCNATSPSDEDFLSRFVPCGTLAAKCGDLPVIFANRDYPGSGEFGDVQRRDYIVQFDIGLHPAVARAALQVRFSVDACVDCAEEFVGFNETCLEVVVRGHSHWGSLGGTPGVAAGAYDCMGRCGSGCMGSSTGGLDCLKHDVCSAWKSRRRGRPVAGYCHDPDCGDEGAQALYNCHDSHGAAPCNESDPSVIGSWSSARWSGMGWCNLYQGWERGQGIPPHGPWHR